MIDLDKVSKLTGFVDKLIQLKGIEDTLDEEKIAGLIQDAINFTQATYSKEEIDAARRDLTWRYEIQTSPGASILSDYEEDNFRFFDIIKKIVENRQSSILHKIVNVYTTNYDLLIESAFEKNHIEYVDGFSGKMRPVFSTANYGMILSRQTSISSMTSEVVTFNLYKVHGSLNWKFEGSEIHNCNHVELIRNIEQHLCSDDFDDYYSSLAIINPTKDKLRQTVLNINYYDQLRMYCNELEKINTILFLSAFPLPTNTFCK